MKKYLILFFPVLLVCISLQAHNPSEKGTPRQLRYYPEGSDFVINNGNLRFNRALYGTNTAFRVEAGDLPEFAIYLPGMGGNLRFGLMNKSGSKWLINAKNITARYRPGSMIYTISDPMLGIGNLQLSVLALADAEGLIVQLKSKDIPENLSLFIAYGGVTGKKFSRNGDLGADPESSFYLKPEYCADNEFVISGNSFSVYFGSGRDKSESERYKNNYHPTSTELKANRLKSKKQLVGVFPPESLLKVSDAEKQNSPDEFYTSVAKDSPALTGKLKLNSVDVQYFLIANTKTIQQPEYNILPDLFEKSELQRLKIEGRIQIHTPDPYINTVGGALSIAADAIWEEPSYLHGAIAWRMHLNGWRGAYTADALGWHDRAKMHFSEYAKSQYIEPASGPSVPDPKTNLARQEEKVGTAIYTEGYISRNPGKISNPHHYDMNLVFIDQLLRHFNWIGDTAYLRQMWPVIERHLAWEKRCFDGNNDGLYDAYCCIWASDALEYSGSGVSHSSAYNYFANKTVARLALLIGKDPIPYQNEAGHILKAINQQLWMPKKGWFAEYKDLLGLQKVHPSAALWTIYHAIDSEVTDPFQSWQCLRYIDTKIPHIPIAAEGLTGNYYTLSTTNWMPYTWSINNVASGEVFHTALAYWQAGRSDEAFRITKSSLLDYMYLGSSPGNFGQLSYYDAFRGELYRDFADGIGAASRALIEGLFGVLPDVINSELLIKPGFPAEWKFASLRTPDIFIDFRRENTTDFYTIKSEFFQNMKLDLRLKAQLDHIKSLTVNGHPATWKIISETIGQPEIKLIADAAEKYEIRIEWVGEKHESIKIPEFYAYGDSIKITTKESKILEIKDPQQILRNPKIYSNSIIATVSGEKGNRTAFVKLKQGEMEWWMPVEFEVRQAVDIVSPKNQPAGSLNFSVRNNTEKSISGTVKVNSFTQKLNLEAHSESGKISVSQKHLILGNNSVRIILSSVVYSKNIQNWKVSQKKNTIYETVDLKAQFNDKVTQIFKNKYLSPRSPYPTLAIPIQGIGDWCSYKENEEIDDSGIRALAGSKNKIFLPNGIPFETPGSKDAINIIFTSLWDNYPNQAQVKLSGSASHVYLLMAGSTHHMQSRFDNGEVIVEYTDGTSEKMVLRNPETWWPIEQDYYDNGLAFDPGVCKPLRLYLKTGEISIEPYPVLNKNKSNKIDGGAATVVDLPLNQKKELKQIKLETLANDVVIGLMAVTLVR